MKALLRVVGGLAAGLALLRFLRGRGGSAVQLPPAPEAPGPDARAEELRRRLAESRAVVEERETFEGAELPVDEAEPAPGPDARRRSVHEAGRAALDDMRGGDSP